MGVGIKIKELRKSKSLTQDEFAKQIGISRTYLSDIENNRKSPTVETLEKIAERSKCFLTINFQSNENTMGERIKKLRLQNGWTMQQLGNQLDPIADKSIVSRWEKNFSIPNSKRVKALAFIFSVTVGYLYSGNSEDEK